jgi:hypothetical protein
MRSFIACTLAKYNENDQVREDEMGRVCRRNGEKKNAYRILVEKPEGKRPSRRPTSKWVDNIKMQLRVIE